MQGGGGLLVPFDHKIYSVTQTQQAISALQLLFRSKLRRHRLRATLITHTDVSRSFAHDTLYGGPPSGRIVFIVAGREVRSFAERLLLGGVASIAISCRALEAFMRAWLSLANEARV